MTMTTEEKIEMLTGALAAKVDRNTNRFWGFEKITAKLAEHLLTCENVRVMVVYTGELCFIENEETVYQLADKSLAAIANA